MAITKQDVKKRIEEYEYRNSGLQKHSGTFVEAVNIKISKTAETIFADVSLINQLEGTVERYNDCTYSFEILGVTK